MLIKIFDSEKNTGIEMELDELTARITTFNSKEDFEYETIKAFAVMGRTELARKMSIYGGEGCDAHKGYDICTTPSHCVEYRMLDVRVPEIVQKAVLDTGNKIITYEGKPIKAYFHYRCGGSTENSENVTGSRITYLRRVLCSYCKDAKDVNNEKYFTVEELEKLLNTKISKPEDVYTTISGMFEDIEIDDQGRIRSVVIGNRKFKGTELMKVLKLSSTRFNYTPVQFFIKSVGTGHGLGLCQCGANQMAKLGRDYEEILRYYYTGVRLEEMQMPESGKPLKGRKIMLDAGYGGVDSGDGKGASGLREKDVNLDIVLKLRELLENDGAAVYLTRDSDESVPLADRAELANTNRADFFISVLQNSFQSPGVSGTEIYHFRGDNESKRLGELIMEEISTCLEVKNRGVRTGEYYLLREVTAPALILQLLYITNPGDEAKLADPHFRERAAQAVRRAILRYYQKD